jgi:selenoprotein W-related protein
VRKSFPVAEVTMLASSGGVFEVTVDGKLVFSKKALGRHAEPGEVLELIRQCA